IILLLTKFIINITFNIFKYIISLYNIFIMNLKSLVKLIFSPKKSLDYFIKFLHLEDKIITSKNCKIAILIKLLNYYLIIKVVHLIYLAINPKLSELERIIQYDASYFITPNPMMNLIAASATLMTVYFNFIIFF